jgi:diaminopimelate epimerase
MHGHGNDFVIFDARNQAINLQKSEIAQLANRNTGIGCDQLIIVKNSNKADCYMEIYNQDASIALACGNAARCVGYLFKVNTIETSSRVISITQRQDNIVGVNMGKAIFMPTDIKLSDLALIVPPVRLSIGNPHLVLIVKNLTAIDIKKIGEYINNVFTDGINVEFVQIISEHHLKMQVYERGVGPTSSCGSGACAAYAACVKHNFITNKVLIEQMGGDLEVYAKDEEIIMSGVVNYVFKGEIN